MSQFKVDLTLAESDFSQWSIKQYIPFYDAYSLWKSGSDYILSEGYERSKQTGVGVLDPIPFGGVVRQMPLISLVADYFIPRIYVFSGTQHNLEQIAGYGEKIKDTRAREPHDRVKQATGQTTIVNQIGPEAVVEKKKIAKNLSSEYAFSYAQELGNNIAELWNNERSLQDNITLIGAKIIGQCFLGINDFPEKYVPMIRKANDLIADGDATSADFAEMKKQMLVMNDDILGKNAAAIIDANAYVLTQFELNGDESIEEATTKLVDSHGGAGFLVESNLSFIIMATLAHVSTSPQILDVLLNELQTNDGNDLGDMKRYVYLDCIYREALRFATPTAVVPRVTSANSSMTIKNTNGEQSNCSIYPNSYLFFAIRAIHHDAQLWENPQLFNPERFRKAAESNKMRFMDQNYFPFSGGKRGCPAGSKFVEYIFKGFIMSFFKNYKLIIDKPLEDIPANAIHPRWKNEYFARLSNHADKENSLEECLINKSL